MAAAFALGLAGCVPGGAPPDMTERRAGALAALAPPMALFPPVAAPAPSRANAEMARDFLDLSFAMESGNPIPRLARFEGPITLTLRGAVPPTLPQDLDVLLTRLRAEAGLNIRLLPAGAGDAAITIETLPQARLRAQVPEAACFVVPRVSTWAEFRRARRGGMLDWTTLDTRERVAVFIPSDVAPQEIRDCLHEEIAQALGPLNDLYRLPDSVFNDDNLNAVLTGFDMLMLRVFYDPRLRSGMGRAEVAAALPGILARLNPGGARPGAAAPRPTPRAWTDAIETALGQGTGDAARVVAAGRAVAIAQRAGLDDARLGFSHYALGRLTLGGDVARSIRAFHAARDIYERLAPGGIHTAHIDMQLAAYALVSDRAEEALTRANDALPAATRAQNAALLSTLLMIRAEALSDLGRPSEARASRLDSLAWGRYGFGGNAGADARLSEVAALSP